MITEQRGENIYNIQGGMHLHQSDDVAALLNKQKQSELSFLNSVEFLEVLKKKYSEKNLIQRPEIQSQLKSVLIESQQVILYGDPGIGKTTLLFQFIETNDVIYISLKDKSAINVLFYLINKIRSRSNKDLVELENVDQALNYFQAELSQSKFTFLLDDCEQNFDLTTKVVALEKFENRFLFASRDRSPFEMQTIRFFKCNPFTEVEIRLFLDINDIDHGLVDFNNIVEISHGNPLYLFYCSNHLVHPLPESVNHYQNQIWNGLNWELQEVLAYVCLPYSNITVIELSELLGLSPIELSKKLDKLASLIKNVSGTLEVFHSSFDEFVKGILKTKGLFEEYCKKVGEFYLKKNAIIEATYLLIEIQPEAVSDYFFEVFEKLMAWGEMEFALKVLTSKLKFTKSDLEKGYTYYHLCTVNHLLGNRKESTACIDNALIFLEKSNSEEILASATMYKAMDLMTYGSIEEAKELADDVFESIKDKEYKAPILVNLSKIYVDLHEFEKGAQTCKDAYTLFEIDNDVYGMRASLLNLITCFAQMPDFRDEAESYGLILLDLVRKDGEYSMEIVVLNSLSSIYRQKGNYDQARSLSFEAVKLCQKHQMKEKVVLNLINYANIIRDEGSIDDSLKIYHEALTYATLYNLKKELGRIYWNLSGIHVEKNELDLSLEFAEKAIKVSTEINFYYGIANAWCEKSEALKHKDDKIGAAKALENAAFFYGKIHEFRKSRQQRLKEAIEIYLDLNLIEEINRVLLEWINHTQDDLCYEDLAQQISSLPSASGFDNFAKLHRKYFTDDKLHSNIIKNFLVYVNYCNRYEFEGGKKDFKDTLKFISQNLNGILYSKSILGFAIEQSGLLLSLEDLIELSSELTLKLPFFSNRLVNEEYIIIATIGSNINLEIHVFDDELTCLKLALASILILSEKPSLIIDNGEVIKEKYCILWIHNLSKGYKKALAGFIPDESELFNEHNQSVHLEKQDYEKIFVLIGERYDHFSDLIKYPEHKVSFTFFAKIFMSLKSHFLHIDSYVKEERKKTFKKVAELMDYFDSVADNEIKDSGLKVDISKLNGDYTKP